MYMVQKDGFRKIGRDLYRFCTVSNAYIRCGTVPQHIKGIVQSIAWYNNLSELETATSENWGGGGL